MMAPDSDIIQIPCRLEADWTDAINYALQEAKEMTIGNYRPDTVADRTQTYMMVSYRILNVLQDL